MEEKDLLSVKEVQEALDANKGFKYAEKVELHALEPNVDLKSVLTIAIEHGFRGIIVTSDRIKELSSLIKKNDECNIKAICVIDYPYGNSSLDVRNFSMVSARKNGADEIEICAPAVARYGKSIKEVHEDITSLTKTAERIGVKVRYLLENDKIHISNQIKTPVCRMIDRAKISLVSVSYNSKEKNGHADAIMNMRFVKDKLTSSKIKSFIDTEDASQMASYVKAGVEIIGLNWRTAPKLVHEYEELVERG